MNMLLQQHCRPPAKGTAPLPPDKVNELLAQVPGWTLAADGTAIEREFRFANYYETIAFVNAVAWIAHQEDHHPDLSVHYNRCRVRFSTHAVGGLWDNDFICAARVSALFRQPE